MTNRRRAFRNLPLFWKVLLPFLALMVAVGATGTLFVVRDLSRDAQSSLDQDLARRSLDTRAAIQDRQLYLLEAVNFAANLQGMASRLETGDRQGVESLLRSVLALKGDLDLLVITDARGGRVVSLTGDGDPHPPEASTAPLISRAAAAPAGQRVVGFIGSGQPMLAVAGTICSAGNDCRPIGTAIAAMSASTLFREAGAGSGSTTEITLYDAEGDVLSTTRAAEQLARELVGRTFRRTETVGSVDVASLYAPLQIAGSPLGMLAVRVPRAPAFASVRGAGIRLALIVFAAMLGVVALGALLSRFILAPVRPLLQTSRALGRGDLEARAPVETNDELGELARGINQMAEQLEASYETLEARVAQRTEEVQRLLEERTAVFASMSHEFRTPLAVILSEVDLLLAADGKVSPRVVKGAGKTIRISGEQLLTVINEILDLAQAASGRIDVEIEAVRVHDVVRELRPTIEGLAKGGELALRIDVPRDLPTVRADPARLREVLLNLVDNAMKYTPSGGRVTVRAEQHNGSVDIAVSDNGIGIPEDVGDRIFEPFFRVKGAKPMRGRSSSGLGLALAKGFVEAQGGTISFESTQDEGTTFTVSLDAVRSSPRGRRRS